ncbi:MAG: ISL3 family transposase [Richelia sp. SM1_7_0]|nr:ISL3 family transposase [Richelia sp. SM1_7_0]
MKILTQLLNLERVKVISHRQYQGVGIILQIESIKTESICPRCGIKSHRLHQNHRYIIKDLPLGEQQVFLEINKRQFKCDKCKKPFSEELNFVDSRRKYTKRLASQTIKEVLDSDIHSVAKKGCVTTEQIERMLKDAYKKSFFTKPLSLKRLGIDEIALVKGKGNYCAVLVDLDNSKLLAILPGRTQEIIKKVLKSWGEEVLQQIEEVSIDLWIGYKNLVSELIPNAQVVADRFHVMTQINKELDSVRKREKRNVEDSIKKTKSQLDKNKYEKILNGLKKSKYALLKNESNLNEEQKIKLEQVKEVSPTLKLMHELKEKIRIIFNETKDWLTGLFQLGMWLSTAKKYFPVSQKTIIRWLDEVIAYFDNGTTSGVVEGINNKLKLIKRSGYGFRNFDNFRIRCLLNWYLDY